MKAVALQRGTKCEPPPQSWSELATADLFTGSNGFGRGYCLPNASYFFLRHYPFLTAELTSTTPLPWVISPRLLKELSCQPIATIKLYLEHFSHPMLILNLAHFSEEGLSCLKAYFSYIWQVSSKSYCSSHHFAPLLKSLTITEVTALLLFIFILMLFKKDDRPARFQSSV